MQTAKKIWSVTSTALVALVVVCAVFLTASRLLGFQAYSVVSGSMEPELKVGDLIYVKSVDSIEDIRVGDDITFVLNEELVVATHRVVRTDAEKQHLYTKGIANELEDDTPVHFKNVIGVVKFNVPLLGYVSDFVQNPPGMYIAIGVGVALLVAVFLPDFQKKKKAEPETAEESAALEENARLKEALETLKAKLEEKDTPKTDDATSS